MVYSYLKEHYNVGEPIFLTDIRIDGISDENLRYHLKTLTDQGLISRFDSGIYYMPKKDILNERVKLSPDTVAVCKYINRNGEISGFYSGYSFANRLGISTQVPYKEEITSNFAPAVVREVAIGKRKYIIRRPVVPITNENKYVLQFLDCLRDIEKTSELDMKECGKILKKYAEKYGITKAKIDKYISYYPIKVFKSIYDTEVKFAASRK